MKYLKSYKITICLAIILIIQLLMFFDFPKKDLIEFLGKWSNYGTLGDFVGGFIGTIAAIIAVYFSYQINQKQFQQFEEQAKEFDKQAAQFKHQSEQSEKQSFENNFFQMISMFNQKVSTLELGTRKADKVYENILVHLKNATDVYANPDKFNSFASSFDLHLKVFQTEYSILILNFKNIVSYIDKSRYNKELKIFYANMFYTYITTSQMEILNRYSKRNGDSLFVSLIEKYPNNLLQ